MFIQAMSKGAEYLAFQNIEVCESKGVNPSEIHLFGVNKVYQMLPSIDAIQADPCEQAGHSILARVIGFEHYFFYPCPTEIKESDMEPLRDYLNVCNNTIGFYPCSLNFQSVVGALETISS